MSMTSLEIPKTQQNNESTKTAIFGPPHRATGGAKTILRCEDS